MSPASKSKLKERKVGKDVQKASLKPSASVNTNSGVSASAYDPHEGTFHTLEQLSTSSAAAPQNNGRFKNIDEPDVTGLEYDSVSNTGSWSGDSEDHKEKFTNTSARNEAIPGADNDKREKIRLKNERKHQRQKERRAQELHERCCGFLMSRKLEALAEQLVAMGISKEQATMALMLNDGKLEESITWLFDRKDEAEKESVSTPGNLKIDITEDLAKITGMEMKYKCTKQEVERAVVAAEGDLENAEEILRAQKKDLHSKAEDSADPLNLNNGKLALGFANQNSAVRTAHKASVSLAQIQQQGNERDFSYAKLTSTVGGSSEFQSRTALPVKKVQPKLEWAKPQQTVLSSEKSLASSGLHTSISNCLSPHSPASKTETHYAALGKGFRNMQQTLIREPIAVVQQTQSASSKLVPATSISSSPGANLHPTANIEIMKSNGIMPRVPGTRSPSPNNLSSKQHFQQLQYQHQQRFALGDLSGPSRGLGLWSRNAASSGTVAAASSLGLFSGLGSNGAPSIDWSTGGTMGPLDYTSIDWSLERSSPLSKPSGLWLASSSPLTSNRRYDSNTNGFGAKPSMRVGALSGGVLADSAIGAAEPSSSRDWTSPFEGKDLFSLPRQFVSSPPL